ncbi:hypothetical protein GCM10009850_105430 [Nonomuraea monospora]|uniref:Secreted protein n=1 Tax=Nonomuraea monospora TaxID=568818 RepID=A0ABN3D012_9ACTN
MIPEGHHIGQGWRAALAALALGVTSLIIYGLFSSGFGRLPRAALPTPAPAPSQIEPAPNEPAPNEAGSTEPGASEPGPSEAESVAGQAAPDPGHVADPSHDPDRPAAASVGQPSPVRASGPALWVVSDDFWLTYLPAGLERTGGAVTASRARAAFGAAGRFVEVQVERGTVAADWDGYRKRIPVLDARATTVRGKPAVVGEHPAGGRVIVWLERPGTGAWIRVSDSLGRELVTLAASVKAPVGD